MLFRLVIGAYGIARVILAYGKIFVWQFGWRIALNINGYLIPV
jgi:hypothetical protein